MRVFLSARVSKMRNVISIDRPPGALRLYPLRSLHPALGRDFPSHTVVRLLGSRQLLKGAVGTSCNSAPRIEFPDSCETAAFRRR